MMGKRFGFGMIAVSLAIVAVMATAGRAAGQATAGALVAKAKPVEVAGITAETLAAVRLDGDVYFGATDGLVDLRVLDGSGRETPYLLRKVVTDKKRLTKRPVAVDSPTVRPLEDGGLEIEITIDPKLHPNRVEGFTFVTPLTNFEHRVTIERVGEDGSAETLAQDALIFDYSQYMAVRGTDVRIPKEKVSSTAGGRYRLRIAKAIQLQESQLVELTRSVRVGDGEGEKGKAEERLVINRQPLRINRVEFWDEEETVESSQPELIEYPVKVVSTEEDLKDKLSRIELDSRREPITELTLVTTDKNFSRTARVMAMTGQAGEPPLARGGRVVGSGSVSRIDLAAVQREDMKLGIPETRDSRYRVELENLDSPPLQGVAFEARGPAYEVVFLAQPGQSYRLSYGDAYREPPRYDIAAIDAALAAGAKPQRLDLGGAVDEAVTTAGQAVWLRRLGSPWVLGPVVLGLVALLAVALRGAAARLDDLKP